MAQVHDSGDDSIDLVELIRALWARKLVIIVAGFACGAIGIAYALLATPIYRAEVVLGPSESDEMAAGGGGLGGLAGLAGLGLGTSTDMVEAIATLRSRAFIEEFISENDLLPVLFADDWDAENGRWNSDDPEDWPDIQDGVRFFIENVRSIDESGSGLVTLAIDWTDPELTAAWAEELVYRINERIRARDATESRMRLEYLNAELAKASLVELRQAISRLIESQVERAMLAQADVEYAFKVIDPPRVPNERIWPQRTLIVIFAGLAGGMIGIVVALLQWRLTIGVSPVPDRDGRAARRSTES